MPPLAACVRTLLPAIVARPSEPPDLFALESTLLEVTFVAGPPLALALGAVWSTGAALVVSGLIAGGRHRRLRGASRLARWRPDARRRPTRDGPLRAAAIWVLILVELGTGSVFGATEVGVTATATHTTGAAAAAPLLGLWGAGLAHRRDRSSPDRRRPLRGAPQPARAPGGTRGRPRPALLGARTACPPGRDPPGGRGDHRPHRVGHLRDGRPVRPRRTQTEAFSWLVTAETAGAAVGAAVGGALAQDQGPAAVFTFAGLAGGVTVVAALVGSRWFGADRDPPPVPQADLA